MIALTARLNERDESILALQEELDQYERQQKSLEDELDKKSASLIKLQRMLIEQNQSSPSKQLMSNVFTEPRYRPHPESGEGTDTRSVLTAEEKIDELTKLIDKKSTKLKQLSAELDGIRNSENPPTSIREQLLLHKLQVAEDELKSLRSKTPQSAEKSNKELEGQLEMFKKKYMEVYEDTQREMQEKDDLIQKLEEENNLLRSQQNSTQLEDEMLTVLRKAEQVQNSTLRSCSCCRKWN
jgi:hypothetical protein